MTDHISFERFLNVRSAYGATFDASNRRSWIYYVSTMTGVPNLWGVPHGGPVRGPAPLAVGPERVQYAFASPRPGRLLYGLDRGGDERTQLWLLDGIGNRARPLTDAPDVIHHFGDWHPDGRQLCYAANRRDQRHFDIYVMDVESGESRLVYEHDSSNRAVGFEPAGRRILIQRLHAPFEHELLLVDPADGTAESLTAGARPGSYESVRWAPGARAIYFVSDRDGDFLAPTAFNLRTRQSRALSFHDWDVEDLTVSPNGRLLVYAGNVDGYSDIWVWDRLTRKRWKLPGPKGQLCNDGGRWTPTFDWSPDGRELLMTFCTAIAPPDVWAADLSGIVDLTERRKPVSEGARIPSRQATRSWTANLSDQQLSRPELVHYPTFDGRRIPAFIFRPPNAPKDGSSPAVIFVHGGPESQFRPSFNPVVQYFAHRGFVVLAPNVRGSTGYGKAYSHLDDVDKRLDAVRDLAAGAEWLAASGEAHPKKIAVMGSSYGGYMVLAALTERPDLWAAGVDIVGIANFVTFLENTGPWRRHLREAEYGSLERDRALLERLSPIHRADRIVAPLLVVHGANDPRVPISETEQIVATLRGLGRPVEYLRFEDEGHGLVKLENRLVAYPRIADFLERVMMHA